MKRQQKRNQALRNAVSMVFIAAMMMGTGLAAADTRASVTEFTNRAAWEAAVGGPYTTIGFTEYPTYTFLTTEYSHLGVTFDGHLFVGFHGDFEGFPNDGSGVLNSTQSVEITFLTSVNGFGVSHPGTLQASFYQDAQLLHTSSFWGGSGAGFFSGFVTDQPFNRVILSDWAGFDFGIDDLHFAVPAPGALIPLLVAGVVSARSRRRW